ncbi:WXG100 family type VII secretion target [Actinophytocola sp.]|uniref:WXG100 family type VII secretion target n=1 Tax=Actinophytocola sp. TaxID=1872138 RepID=UPI00389AF966
MVEKMVVTFAALQDAERDIRSCVTKVRGKLDDLDGYLTPLTGSWTGDAATAYQARMREWRAAAKDLADALERIAGIVHTAESNYGNAVATNKSIWPVR